MYKSNDEDRWGCVIYFIVFLFWGVFMLFSPIWGVDGPTATRVLTESGYKNVKITGYRWFAGNGDWYHTGFSAESPTGTSVTGTVTGGLIFKGNTIRLD